MLTRLLARVGLTTREQRAWAWYDWANSVYFTTVITAVFPSFYSTYAAAGLEPAQATARFAMVTTVSVAVVAVISPILGALADYSGIKKKLLSEALTRFFEIRETPGLNKKPSTSEALDWIRLLVTDDVEPETLAASDKNALPKLHGALLKNEQDVHLFERLAFMARREMR